MTSIYRLKLFFLIALSALSISVRAQNGSKSIVITDQVRAELIAHAPQGLVPGATVWAGLRLIHQPHWHTYWKNPGDSGLPTQLQWTLPPGIVAGDIAWPMPQKLRIGTLANYGYEGTVLLPVPLTITPDWKPGLLGNGDATLKLQASWLVCRQECIPEEGSFTLQLASRSSTAAHGADFERAWAAQPRTLALDRLSPATPANEARVVDGKLVLRVAHLPVEFRGQTLQVFPETQDIIETAADPEQSWTGAVWTARIPLSSLRTAGPLALPMVLAHGKQALRLDFPVRGAWPAASASTTLSPALEAALKANAQRPQTTGESTPPSFWLALIGAVLGGLILNLMPCVFPVLAIKVLGFAQHLDDHKTHRASGLAYTAGVITSFIGLGAVLLGLRAAGESLGWGFQLQSPAVVAGLAVLFTVIGLNLAGLFELGAWLPSRLASLQARHPVMDAFLTGVLAVAIASPCTAPFMGASLGLAISLPAGQALALFAAIGLGLSLPYLAASWIPAVAGLLPRPGAWMDTLRRFMAFPMFATVVWLVWVLGQQTGIDGASTLLALLVACAMALWAGTLGGRSRAMMLTISIASIALIISAGAKNMLEISPSTHPTVATERWQPWTQGTVDSLLASGRPVFVDFTAAWCVTCQYNKKTTLADPAILADFDAKQVQLLRADWTRRDPAITAALTALGRSGVPVYVLYRPSGPPQVLSEILSVSDVRHALATVQP
jgi:thiol:disulfide interchange protein